MRHAALDFLLTLNEDRGAGGLDCRQGADTPKPSSISEPAPATPTDSGPSLSSAVTDKLALWLSLRYAAVAQTLVPADDKPEAELLRLREFCRNIVALRRGDLSAGRLSLEHARVGMEQVKSGAEVEKLFWEWIKRPEIAAKLNPILNSGKIRDGLSRPIDHQLLGIKPRAEPTAEPDAAVLV